MAPQFRPPSNAAIRKSGQRHLLAVQATPHSQVSLAERMGASLSTCAGWKGGATIKVPIHFFRPRLHGPFGRDSGTSNTLLDKLTERRNRPHADGRTLAQTLRSNSGGP